MNFISCTTSFFGLGSFLESIEHDFIKVLKIQTDRFRRHQSRSQEVLGRLFCFSLHTSLLVTIPTLCNSGKH